MDAARGVSGAGVLPAGLASLAPGAALAGVLASVDRSTLDADAVLDLVAARARLLWHVQGELLADLAQAVAATVAASEAAGAAGEDVDRVVGAVGELVGWTLHWTSGYAQGQVEVGVVLAQRLPMVLAAVRDGLIDQAKAAAFVDGLGCVTDEVAVRIASRLLPKAQGWTLTQLRAALRYHVDRADPGAARRRYRRRVAQRDVWLRAQPDGTASLCGQGLAAHRAAAAYDRIDRLARAARSGGDVRTLAQLRADALCDVLAGVPFTIAPAIDPGCVKADAAAETHPERAWSLPDWPTEPRYPTRTTGNDRPDGGGGPDGGGWSGGPTPPEVEPTGAVDLYEYDRACLTDEDRAWVGIGWQPPGAADDELPPWWSACRPTQPRDPPHPDSRPANRNGPPPGPRSRSSEPARDPTAPDSRSTNRTEPASGPTGWGSEREPQPVGANSWSESENPGSDPEDLVWALAQADVLHLSAVLCPDVLPADRCACGGLLSLRPGTVDVQIALSTLAGLDEHPALIPALGPILAPIARQIAFDPHTRPTWRWSVFDEYGDLLHHGRTRHRPARPEPCSGTEELPSRTGKTHPGPDSPQPPPYVCRCPRVEPGPRRGSIEVQLTLATLHELLTHPQRIPGWHPVLADIAAHIEQDTATNPPDKWQQTDQHGNLLPHGHTGRMPNATEDAFIRARDRSCRTPNCPTPATRCELDHRIEHAKSGPSHRGNVDARCTRHHHLRERGYHITKTGRTTTWTTPNGRTFTVTTDKDLILTRDG